MLVMLLISTITLNGKGNLHFRCRFAAICLAFYKPSTQTCQTYCKRALGKAPKLFLHKHELKRWFDVTKLMLFIWISQKDPACHKKTSSRLPGFLSSSELEGGAFWVAKERIWLSHSCVPACLDWPVLPSVVDILFFFGVPIQQNRYQLFEKNEQKQ